MERPFLLFSVFSLFLSPLRFCRTKLVILVSGTVASCVRGRLRIYLLSSLSPAKIDVGVLIPTIRCPPPWTFSLFAHQEQNAADDVVGTPHSRHTTALTATLLVDMLIKKLQQHYCNTHTHTHDIHANSHAPPSGQGTSALSIFVDGF